MALVLAEAQVQAQEVVEDAWDLHRRRCALGVRRDRASLCVCGYRLFVWCGHRLSSPGLRRRAAGRRRPWLLPLRAWLLGGVLRPSTRLPSRRPRHVRSEHWGEPERKRRRRAPEQRAFDARRRQGQGCSWVTIFKLAATIFKLHGPCHHLMDPVSI